MGSQGLPSLKAFIPTSGQSPKAEDRLKFWSSRWTLPDPERLTNTTSGQTCFPSGKPKTHHLPASLCPALHPEGFPTGVKGKERRKHKTKTGILPGRVWFSRRPLSRPPASSILQSFAVDTDTTLTLPESDRGYDLPSIPMRMFFKPRSFNTVLATSRFSIYLKNL